MSTRPAYDVRDHAEHAKHVRGVELERGPHGQLYEPLNQPINPSAPVPLPAGVAAVSALVRQQAQSAMRRHSDAFEAHARAELARDNARAGYARAPTEETRGQLRAAETALADSQLLLDAATAALTAMREQQQTASGSFAYDKLARLDAEQCDGAYTVRKEQVLFPAIDAAAASLAAVILAEKQAQERVSTSRAQARALSQELGLEWTPGRASWADARLAIVHRFRKSLLDAGLSPVEVANLFR